MNRKPTRWRIATATFAAMIFIIQSFLSSAAQAAMSGRPLYDAFGNPLCAYGLVKQLQGKGASQGAEHCAISCIESGAKAPPLVSSQDAYAPERFVVQNVAFATLVTTEEEHPSASPRAPPALP